MSLKPQLLRPIPTEIAAWGAKHLSNGSPYKLIGDSIFEQFRDEDFADLYPRDGQPSLSPVLLAFVTVFKALENLSDRATANAVRSRLDWKYALHLPLDDDGFDHSVLCEFRARLLKHDAEARLFERVLVHLKTAGLLKARGIQRTDSLALLTKERREIYTFPFIAGFYTYCGWPPITSELTLGAFLQTHITKRDERVQLLELLAKTPYYDVIKPDVKQAAMPAHHCSYRGQSLEHKSVAYAAHLSPHGPFCGTHRPAALVSLGDSPNFCDDLLEVEYQVKDATQQKHPKQGKKQRKPDQNDGKRSVWNVTRDQQVATVRRNYRANSGKHPDDGDLDAFVSAMDLGETEAREVLREGVLLPKQKRIFGQYKSQYYIFPCHDKEKNEFHGFRVQEQDIRKRMGNVHAQLRKMGFFK